MQMVKVGRINSGKDFEDYLNRWLDTHPGWRIGSIYPLSTRRDMIPMAVVVFEEEVGSGTEMGSGTEVARSTDAESDERPEAESE